MPRAEPAGAAMTSHCQVSITEVSMSDRAVLVSIIEKCDNLSHDERACAIELLDIYLDDPDQEDYLFLAAASTSGSLLGFVCYGERALAHGVYDLYWVVVDPENRRSGVGSALLAHTAESLKARGARMLVAETSGMASYGAARKLYAKAGFLEEARIKDFYRPGDDIVFCVKRL